MKHLLAFCAITLAAPSLADAPVIEKAEIRHGALQVTLSHSDTGWDHYANLWQVFDEAGNLLGERVLLHPHVNEQPFTRSTKIDLPDGAKQITIIASCNQTHVSAPYVLTLNSQ